MVHHPNRLTILSYLSGVDSAIFSELKEFTGLTDGNLGSHLQKLEEERYIRLKKEFVQNKPLTTVFLTKKGRAELLEYVQSLKKLIESVNV